jgi:hypothetical protein
MGRRKNSGNRKDKSASSSVIKKIDTRRREYF